MNTNPPIFGGLFSAEKEQDKMNYPKAKYYSGCGTKIQCTEPVYQYPKNHPCHGCPYKFPVSKPSCTMGSRPPDCAWHFYQKIMKRRIEVENKE
ncbi:MAG: hypothetical protein RSA20_08250 [Oscillospiraceae bacterium]